MYIFFTHFLMKLQYMDTLTAFYPMALHLMFDEFLLEKNYSHIHCDFLIITFLNDLPHSMNVTSYGVSSLFSNVFNILHMLQHKMFLEFLNAIPHSMHVTTMMFCKIPSQEQPFLAFYAYTWILFLWVCTKTILI